MTPTSNDLKCANCGRVLDPHDKFCRECGLPTLRRAQSHAQVPQSPPDTGEMKRAMDAVPDPKPFLRSNVETAPALSPVETTGSIIHATSPTHATNMASVTMLMVGAIVILAMIGLVLLFLAFRA